VLLQCGERGPHPRPVLRDISAVQREPFPADANRCLRVAHFERKLGAERVLAQLTVKIVEYDEDELGRCSELAVMGQRSGKMVVGALHLVAYDEARVARAAACFGCCFSRYV